MSRKGAQRGWLPVKQSRPGREGPERKKARKTESAGLAIALDDQPPSFFLAASSGARSQKSSTLSWSRGPCKAPAIE